MTNDQVKNQGYHYIGLAYRCWHRFGGDSHVKQIARNYWVKCDTALALDADGHYTSGDWHTPTATQLAARAA